MKVVFFRRITQISIFTLFILSSHFGINILQGNLSSSLIFETIPLSDPFAVIQLLLAGMGLSLSAILGAVLVLAFYAFVAPRAFCSWVCPINLFADIAYKIKHKFGFNKDAKVLNLSKNTRYYLLFFMLLLSFVFGFAAFESLSYIGLLQRDIIFFQASVFAVILSVLVFEIFILERGICSYICPLGAFYALVSKFSFIRVRHHLDKCTHCNKCKRVCPEVQVLDMIGKRSDFVRNSECISCGACIDVCDDAALEFSIKNLRRKDEI